MNCPQITLNIIGTCDNLNRSIAEHLTLAIQSIGCTAAQRQPITLDDISWANDHDIERSLLKLGQKWSAVEREICQREDIQDFLINVQTMEHLSAFTTVLQSAASNSTMQSPNMSRDMKWLQKQEKRSFCKMEQLYDEEHGCSHMRIKIYVLKPDEWNQVDMMIEHAAKMSNAKRKVIFRDGVDRPGDIWSQIYGIISAEPIFEKLLKSWTFNVVAAQKKHMQNITRKNKRRKLRQLKHY